MLKKDISVFGLYATRAGAENAMSTLKIAEYDSANISVLFPFIIDAPPSKETQAPKSSAVSAAKGAVVGGVLGSLVGMGLLGIPGVGPFLAAGPVVAALSFAGAGSAFGGIAGGLIAMGISDVDAKKYEVKIRKNEILLSVHNLSLDSSERAREILKLTGAEDITSSVEIPVNPGVPLDSDTVDGTPPSTLLESSLQPPSLKAAKAAERKKAIDYISPSQPLDVSGPPAHVA